MYITRIAHRLFLYVLSIRRRTKFQVIDLLCYWRTAVYFLFALFAHCVYFCLFKFEYFFAVFFLRFNVYFRY